MKTKQTFLLFFYFSCCILHAAFPQAGEWVWIKGSNTPNQPGNFGTQGVASPANNPPALYEACEWTDLNGNFWLFGGNNDLGWVGDLWKYDPVTNEWTWMKGSGLVNDPGSYGVQGVPSAANNPPARCLGIVSWSDASGNLWMFGGWGGGVSGYLNDLWRYSISTNEWTWMKGTQLPDQTGIYGTQGVADPANNPGGRAESAAAWTDAAGDLWFFGGSGSQNYVFNDLWRYTISSNQWTWMKGSQLVNQAGIYGTLGIEHPANTPGARMVYSHWKDASGRFWLFAGGNYLSNFYFNDLWRYNPVSNNWTWISGDSTINANGVYGTKCIAAATNIPDARFENRCAWTDQYGNFWFFGGGLSGSFSDTWSDLWMYCVSTGKWIWISGSDFTNPAGNWGTIGVSNPANIPDGRAGSPGWTDSNGHLYFFGGSTTNYNTPYNDLWKYTIDTACAACPINTSAEETSSESGTIKIFPDPAGDYCELLIGDFAWNEKAAISITDMSGKRIYLSEIAGPKLRIDLRNFSGGIYIIRIYIRNSIFQKKLVVNH